MFSIILKTKNHEAAVYLSLAFKNIFQKTKYEAYPYANSVLLLGIKEIMKEKTIALIAVMHLFKYVKLSKEDLA